MNINLINLFNLVKSHSEKYILDEIAKGEKREDIRFVDIDWKADKELSECLNQLIDEGVIEKTDNEKVCIPTEEYYKNLRKYTPFD